MYNIRNFSIIAHIDHGKSTLSDCIIKICGGLSKREMFNQVLDSMDLERERGITIKAQSVSLKYNKLNYKKYYNFNLIDTPGHVDFSYEVSRSLSACEGALLLVDSVQGVEAQTLANFYKAIEMNLKIVVVINKIDLPNADIDRVSKEIENIIGVNAKDIVLCSAKTGIGVDTVIERIIKDIPPPLGDPKNPLQALIIDSWFDNFLGVVSLVRIKNGTICKGEKIKVMSTNQIYKVNRLGIFTPKRIDCDILKCGEVGWISCTMKDIYGAQVGDTFTLFKKPAITALPGFKKITPQIYASLFPINSNDYESFRDALGKLSLNDASLFYEPEISKTLGLGFHCGFLGKLHMEIIKERLEREYKLELITTAPTVIYEILTNDNNIKYINNPSKIIHLNKISEIREPIAECNIFLPKKFIGKVINLCIKRRGVQTNIIYHENHVLLKYEIPMVEVILDFFYKIKSTSMGYGSLEYKFKKFKKSDMVLLDIFINGEKVDALSLIVHRNNSLSMGRDIVEKINELIPRQQFNINIQAAIGKRIIASSKIKQLRKNVLAKCYGGDVSRKKKLLKKQKKGKKKLKKFGNIYLSKPAFLSVLNFITYKK